MGVDAGDFDNDGDEDLFMTELNGEGSNLYVNDGTGIFDDHGARSALGPSSLQYTGFGTAWFDFDNDGWLDVLSVNGACPGGRGRHPATVSARPAEAAVPQSRRRPVRRRQRQAGAAFAVAEVGRGAAFGDLDNDGDRTSSSATTPDRRGCWSIMSATAITGSGCASWANAPAATCSARASRSSAATGRS